MPQSKDTAADSATIAAQHSTAQDSTADAPQEAAAETPRIGLLRRIGFGRTAPEDAEGPAFGRKPDVPKGRPLAEVLPRHVPLAAAVALALALGALVGAGATLSLQREAAPDAHAAAREASPDRAIAAATQQLQDSVAQLRTEVAALKSGIASAQRSAGAQFGKLAEGLARLEKRQIALADAAPTVTGSVTAVAKQDPKQEPKQVPLPEAKPEPKNDSKPPVAEGWRLLDFYAGRAVVETPAGRLYDVGAGSNLPGLGRVQSIKREDGRIVLTARNGIVAGTMEAPRPPYYRPYR